MKTQTLEQTIWNKKSFIGKAAEWYFKPKSFEKSGKIYEILGVKSFKKLPICLAKLVYKKNVTKHRNTYFIGKDKSPAALKKYEIEARINEMFHTPSAIVASYVFMRELSQGDYCFAIASFGVLAFNTYCSMLQRYNRARIYNILEKKEAK
jgi:hypothetical protein